MYFDRFERGTALSVKTRACLFTVQWLEAAIANQALATCNGIILLSASLLRPSGVKVVKMLGPCI